MEQPPGWESFDKPKETHCCMVNRSMYGLPQASHQELKAALTAKGDFVSTASDDCIYVNEGKHDNYECIRDDYAALGAHVDDLTSIGTDQGLDKLRLLLKKHFKITEKINPTMITGVQVERNRKARWPKIHKTVFTRYGSLQWSQYSH